MPKVTKVLVLCFIFVLFFLKLKTFSPAYAGCTWRCAYDCAQGEVDCGSQQNPYCNRYYIYCCTGSCPVRPTNTPPGVLPTYTPTPAVGGEECTPGPTGTAYCESRYCHDPACSAFCNSNGHCYVTHPTPGVDKKCSDGGWGPWSACTCDKGKYGGCSETDYCGQVRFCNDPGSNHYQINCCIPGSGGGADATNRPKNQSFLSFSA